jgi:pimeloyl-ACP methyl ester carboxylesterase
MRTETIYKSDAGRAAIMAAYDAALSNYWPAHETLLVPTRYGDTFVVVAGQPGAPPLVLLHGAGSNSAVWAGDAAAFAPHYRVHAVDLIGEPGKSAPTRPPWDRPAFAEWLADVLDGLKLARVALLGISQGGWTTLNFATTWPERVEQLVLLAPGGVVKDRTSFLLKAVGYSLLGERGQEATKRLVLGDVEIPAELDDYLTLIMTEFKPRIGALPIFTDEELSRLAMPVLLIGGDRDVIRDEVAIAARLERLLTDVQIVILPGVGHTLTATTAYTLPFLGIPQATTLA